MPTIFLSHTSIDKPFVEKLAKDLNHFGINVWYDKYEIKVGESILWKIDEGIRDSEYLGIVISKEAFKSEWVKTEITTAWQKQVQKKGNFVLPIYYSDCEIPLFLQGIKYADFRKDYRQGLKDLVNVFGIKDIDVIDENNWRSFVGKKNSNWREFRDREYSKLITKINKIARENNFNVWGGASKNPYSFVINGWISKEKNLSISIRIMPSNAYRYMETDTREWNPNNIAIKDYQTEIGSTVDEVEKYVFERVQNFVKAYGKPKGKSYLFTERRWNIENKIKQIIDILKDNNWDTESRSFTMFDLGLDENGYGTYES
jgi:hypothetical protein